jgi:phage tail protein X
MDDLKKLTQQFVQAANVQAPASSVPELQNFFKSAFMEGNVKRGLQAGGALSGQRAKEADEADEMARKKQIAALQDQADPSKYQKVRKTDGGFQFLDPNGKEIDINTYAQRTGQRRAEVLSDSENPIDQEYINDYNNMNELAQAFYNNDTATIQAYQQANPGLANRKPADLMSELIRKYPHIYGRGGSGAQGYQQTLKNRSMQIFSPGALGGGAASTGGGWSPS